MGTFDYTYEERQRDVTAGHYIPFYIEAPIEDLTVVIGEETVGETITVACQVVDPGGDAIEEAVVLEMILFSDEDYTTLAGAALADITIDPDTDKGMIFQEIVADYHVRYLTNASGELDLVFTDAGGAALEAWIGFILPNGKFVEGGHVAFAA